MGRPKAEGPSANVRVNQTLHGAPAQIIIDLKREGYFRTTSQAINEAVVQLGDIYAERKLRQQRLKALEDEQHE
jgi:hypothetical protein